MNLQVLLQYLPQTQHFTFTDEEDTEIPNLSGSIMQPLKNLGIYISEKNHMSVILKNYGLPNRIAEARFKTGNEFALFFLYEVHRILIYHSKQVISSTHFLRYDLFRLLKMSLKRTIIFMSVILKKTTDCLIGLPKLCSKQVMNAYFLLYDVFRLLKRSLKTGNSNALFMFPLGIIQTV